MTLSARSAGLAGINVAVRATYGHRADTVRSVRTSAPVLFDRLDDQTRLGEHMGNASMMMMGGRMSYSFDAGRGRTIGSVIRMRGRFLGLALDVEEVVTERAPPSHKTWETRGQSRLLVIANYRMGFKITSLAPELCQLRVFIEYNRPHTVLGRIVGPLLAPVYARWCVRRMAGDAEAYFRSGDTAAVAR